MISVFSETCCFLSRGKYLTLKRSIFLRICHLFPPPEIDLFASVLTFQLPKYCSRVPQVWAYRRDVVPVVRAPFIRVSSFQSAPQSPSESGSRWSRPPSDSPPPPLWPQRPWFLHLLSLLVGLSEKTSVSSGPCSSANLPHSSL